MNLDFLDLSGKVGVFDQLREANGGVELSNDMKDSFLEMIDIEKNEEGYYIDAFGNPISFNGLPGLVKGKTKLNLNTTIENEIIVCSKNFKYFRKNYCKIVTKGGINRPDPRPYQERAEDELIKGGDIVLFYPRQCISGKTKINIDGINQSIEDLYLNYRYLENQSELYGDNLFIESYNIEDDLNIETNEGFKNILNVHKTIPLDKYKIITDCGVELEGSGNHVIIDEHHNEVQMRDSIHKNIITKSGISKVIEVIDMGYKEHMYDISIESKDELYYTSSILSHNSGKTVTVAQYLLWCALFDENINIGIAANVQKIATEILDKIKKMYSYLPVWLQTGLLAWNKQSIELSNGVKVLTSATNGDSFRSFTCKIIYIDECISENETISIKNIFDNTYTDVTISELYKDIGTTNNNKYLVKTNNGYKGFKGVKKTQNHQNLVIYFDKGNICVTNYHKFYEQGNLIYAKDLNVGDIISNKKIIRVDKNIEYSKNFYDLIEVEGGNHYTTSNVESSNCAFIPQNTWNEFSDSVFPAQDALAEKQTIISSTANGMGNSFYHLVKGARENTNGYTIVECDWKEVPRWNKDGSIKEPRVFEEEQIAKNGLLHFSQNFKNEFLGSSNTLISTDALKTILPLEDDQISFDSLFSGLRVFNEREIGHNYILTCDPKKKGTDPAALQVIDVTKLPFVQVASAQLDEDFITLPERLFVLGSYYNDAMVVSENNIGESIPYTLFYQYEYGGEVFTERDKDFKLKKEMGFRTTTKSKTQILTHLKKFIESGDLIVQDKATLEELFNFVKDSSGKYSADGSSTDDLVMSLALLFAPFLDVKNWDNFKGFVEYLEGKKEHEEKMDDDFVEFLDLGFTSHIGDDETDVGFTKDIWGDSYRY